MVRVLHRVVHRRGHDPLDLAPGRVPLHREGLGGVGRELGATRARLTSRVTWMIFNYRVGLLLWVLGSAAGLQTCERVLLSLTGWVLRLLGTHWQQ